ncbi:MAG: DUF2911 domain-containing protein [Rhodothermales bacterium]
MFMRLARSVLIVAAAAFLASPVVAQMYEHPPRDNSEVRVSPNGLVAQTIGTAQFSISYSRPFVKGRKVFGELQPFGDVWRSGANEATTIVIPVDITVEGQPLAAGVYALMTIPGEKEWSVIFNSQAKQWGAFKYDPAKDALVVKVDSKQAPHQEMLTYSFEDVTENSATIVLHWGTTAVPFHIQIAG